MCPLCCLFLFYKFCQQVTLLDLIGEKNSFTNFYKLCLYYYKFWSLDLQIGTWFFALVMKFLGKYWVPKHINIDLFDTLGRNLQDLSQKYGLIKLILVYVKYEASSSNIMINILKSMVNYESLGVAKKIQSICFGHVISKVCQYAIVDEKVHMSVQYVSIKFS